MDTKQVRAVSAWEGPLLRTALADALRKLDPRVMARNPVMFVVEVGSVLTTAVWVRDLLATHSAAPTGFTGQVTLWLWFTVVFANFAEALAEGRGKAQAAALRGLRQETLARKLVDGGLEGEITALSHIAREQQRRVARDVREDPAGPRALEEPLGSGPPIQTMRAEPHRLDDLADGAGLHELPRSHGRSVLEALAEADGVDPPRLRLDAARLGQLVERGERRLVAHVVLAVAHRLHSQRAPVARDGGAHDQVDPRILQDLAPASRAPGLRVPTLVLRREVGLLREEPSELRAGPDQEVGLRIDVVVIHPDDTESDGRWHGAHRGGI